MADDKEQEPSSNGSLYDTLWNVGSSAWKYASDTVNSFLGYEDLDVIDPDAGEAEHLETDENDYEAFGTVTLPTNPEVVVTGVQQRQKEFTSYRDYIGQDITSLVSLPVWIMEPVTILQRMAEIMEYTEQLDKAALCEDPYERMAWVVGHTMGPFGCVERTWKPFNPILGETFELDLDRGVRYLAEQVSHHPPIGAAHAENANWEYDIVSAPSTKFLGNSVEIYPVGRSRFKLKTTGEVFSLVPPNCKAHNVIMGRVWVDTFGTYTLHNITTGAVCEIYFQPCGWFGSGRYEVSGHIMTPEGKKVIALAGMWNDHLDMQKCDEEGDPLPDAPTVRLWQCTDKPENKYGFPHFLIKCNETTGLNPMPSDSRRRPDRYGLANGDNSTASSQKYILEERQRAEKRERLKRGDKWKPRWFVSPDNPVVHPNEYPAEECPVWEFTGDYYKQPKRTAKPDDDCGGKDFNPWCYPEIHK